MTISKTELEFHRKTASDCFNKAWDLLERTRDSADDLQLLNMVHTSRYHWGLVGKPHNTAVGDWQISRAYAAMGEGRIATKFAMASLTNCQENLLTDILHTAYEGVARAYAVDGKFKIAEAFLKKARTHLASLRMSPKERDIYATQIDETEALIRSRSRK